jgi:hypothetical protein
LRLAIRSIACCACPWASITRARRKRVTCFNGS